MLRFTRRLALGLAALAAIGGAGDAARAEDSGSSVVVVYNTRMPESKRVAEYYASKRGVPAEQVMGFELPSGEAISRADYISQLQEPLLKRLEAGKLLVIGPGTNQVSSTIRYAVTCYGVPVKILRDSLLSEKNVPDMPAEMRRNEASVDSQLAALPSLRKYPFWTGPMLNPGFGATNREALSPTNGLLLVGRLDGPTAEIARGLVDKAMEVDTNGLWGRAYFDARGLTNAGYQLGDDWMREGASLCHRYGYETSLDNNPSTFNIGYPMSHIAFYAGWYDAKVSGPFTRPEVEFMPGAFAYHLHSFSAATLRTTNDYWVGPLLAKGATMTFGSVDEPYLSATPNVPLFISRLIGMGFTFGEAAYAAHNVLSWQGIVVGDPLCRPFGMRPDRRFPELQKRESPMVEWFHVQAVNLNTMLGFDSDRSIQYLEKMPLTRKSAVMSEKLADLYWARKELSDALDTYERALKTSTSPQQKIRLMLILAPRQQLYGRFDRAVELYTNVAAALPDSAERLGVYKSLLPLAQRLEKKEVAARCEKEIARLSTAVPQ